MHATQQVIDLRRQQPCGTYLPPYSCNTYLCVMLQTGHRHAGRRWPFILGKCCSPRIEECFNCLALFIDSRATWSRPANGLGKHFVGAFQSCAGLGAAEGSFA